jgi:HTH-type transcriptional regulator/antitoxin HigA
MVDASSHFLHHRASLIASVDLRPLGKAASRRRTKDERNYETVPVVLQGSVSGIDRNATADDVRNVSPRSLQFQGEINDTRSGTLRFWYFTPSESKAGGPNAEHTHSQVCRSAKALVCGPQRNTPQPQRSRFWLHGAIRNTIGESGKVPAIAERLPAKYLVREEPPKIISSVEQHEAYIQRLLDLQRKAHRTAEGSETAKLLIVPIADYEAKHFTIDKVSGVEVLRELMDTNGLRQKDLADDLGCETIVSLILKEKRQPNRQQMEKLSRRFHVPPAVFF